MVRLLPGSVDPFSIDTQGVFGDYALIDSRGKVIVSGTTNDILGVLRKYHLGGTRWARCEFAPHDEQPKIGRARTVLTGAAR